MNNARMWLVVHPTIGIPLFLGAVAVGSFSVHVAVLTNAGWVGDFLQGKELGSTAALKQSDGTATVVFRDQDKAATGLAREATVTLPDGRTGTAYFEPKVTKEALLTTTTVADAGLKK